MGQSLRRISAAGLDGVPAGLLDAMMDDLLGCVYAAFCDRLLGRDAAPVDWSVSLLRLLVEPGKPRGKLTSWRPICAVACLSKLYECFLLSAMGPSLRAPPRSVLGFEAGRQPLELVAYHAAKGGGVAVSGARR